MRKLPISTRCCGNPWGISLSLRDVGGGSGWAESRRMRSHSQGRLNRRECAVQGREDDRYRGVEDGRTVAHCGHIVGTSV